jgi:hypothetical protein
VLLLCRLLLAHLFQLDLLLLLTVSALLLVVWWVAIQHLTLLLLYLLVEVLKPCACYRQQGALLLLLLGVTRLASLPRCCQQHHEKVTESDHHCCHCCRPVTAAPDCGSPAAADVLNHSLTLYTDAGGGLDPSSVFCAYPCQLSCRCCRLLLPLLPLLLHRHGRLCWRRLRCLS